MPLIRMNCRPRPDAQVPRDAGLLGVPPLSGLGDDRGDLHAVVRDQVLSGPHDPVGVHIGFSVAAGEVLAVLGRLLRFVW